MTHVVTGRCVDCRYTDCCTVCPVECFYEVTDLAMLVIDPDTCIDCELCVPECPINAIYPEDELPECYEEWVDKNEQLYEDGEVITEQVEALEGARRELRAHGRLREHGQREAVRRREAEHVARLLLRGRRLRRAAPRPGRPAAVLERPQRPVQ